MVTRNIGPVFSAVEGCLGKLVLSEILNVGRRYAVWRGMSSGRAC